MEQTSINAIDSLAKLITNHGLAIVISAIFLITYLRNDKKQEERNEEILEIISIIKETLQNRYVGVEVLKLMGKMRIRTVLNNQRHNVVMYVVKNNICLYFDNIKLEIEKYNKEANNRTMELLRKHGDIEDVLKVVEVIDKALATTSKSSLDILEELKNPVEKVDRDKIIRAIENHYDIIENEAIKEMEELNI